MCLLMNEPIFKLQVQQQQRASSEVCFLLDEKNLLFFFGVRKTSSSNIFKFVPNFNICIIWFRLGVQTPELSSYNFQMHPRSNTSESNSLISSHSALWRPGNQPFS
ncbi:hypothetical protein ILYODFUR_002409 [Ilyodon furcidens]|uniref:Uncharacterized protein n=1 Tax=Ilyodon furcidens TaxID=33524 RepID=A0ABV0VB40_9TELE